ncbi:MAG TPA: hypothetical protein DCF96_01775 [Rhodobacteraceae bacterium]|nr:hypothetical protein [Paracoccaceae bacterium]|tara:strand:- start:19458 stop:19910 length:453 start_codon:yes stop_codon:yes gene_type:complete
MAALGASYQGIKKAIDVGRDISGMAGTVGQWSKAMSDIDYMEDRARNPPAYKLFSNTETDVLELWAHKQKAKEMREELKNHISWTYGPSAWEEILRMEAEQRKIQRELVYKKQEFIDNCLNAIIIGLLLLGGIASLVFVLYLYNERNGNY